MEFKKLNQSKLSLKKKKLFFRNFINPCFHQKIKKNIKSQFDLNPLCMLIINLLDKEFFNIQLLAYKKIKILIVKIITINNSLIMSK